MRTFDTERTEREIQRDADNYECRAMDAIGQLAEDDWRGLAIAQGLLAVSLRLEQIAHRLAALEDGRR